MISIPKPPHYYSREFAAHRERVHRGISAAVRGPAGAKNDHLRALIEAGERSFRRRVVYEKSLHAKSGAGDAGKARLNAELDLDLHRRAFNYAARRMHWASPAKKKSIVRLSMKIARLQKDSRAATPRERHAIVEEIHSLDRVLAHHLGEYWNNFSFHASEYYKGVHGRYFKGKKE